MARKYEGMSRVSSDIDNLRLCASEKSKEIDAQSVARVRFGPNSSTKIAEIFLTGNFDGAA